MTTEAERALDVAYATRAREALERASVALAEARNTAADAVRLAHDPVTRDFWVMATDETRSAESLIDAVLRDGRVPRG